MYSHLTEDRIQIYVAECVYINGCVPVVWDQGLRPGESYCTSAQASHWAETPWEQSHGATSSLTSQRWHTPPAEQDEISFPGMSLQYICRLFMDHVLQKQKFHNVGANAPMTDLYNLRVIQPLAEHRLYEGKDLLQNHHHLANTNRSLHINRMKKEHKVINKKTNKTLTFCTWFMPISRITYDYGWVTGHNFPVGHSHHFKQ